ncbi:MAG: pyridoxal phosphate-dependent aminotransferase [Paraburkholderia sp.]|uniref:pyridoxal phosphate-dependent aminotransferase n=1 Tax=Burkholderiaceae TaxID=119060 RepID=UPI0010F53502|nr:pyridoxal phosphate-dependent aminotransferase [Burkholderia sp. 4M9327F10]
MTSEHRANRLSGRLAAMRPSATGAMSQAARALAAQGRPVISLSEGELDFDTPAHIQHAAIRAIVQGETRYTDVGGTPALKAAIAAKFRRDNGLAYEPREIIAATGAKQIIFNAFLATLDPGDEVIVPAPYWVSYPEMIRMAGGTPVMIATRPQDGFKLQPDELSCALTSKTRWLLLNSPGNPSGALYSGDELRALAQVLRDHPDVLVLSDDIYEEIVFDGTFCSFAQAAPDMSGRTLTLNGVSKSYAMTGWRLGYAGGPHWLISALAMLQSQSTSNPNSISQAAALQALQGPREFLDEWRGRLRVRRDLALEILGSAKPWLKAGAPPAAFYLFAHCGGAIGRRTPQGAVIATDIDLAQYLLYEADVAVVPGSAFGMAPYLRLAYALSDARLSEACERIVAALRRLA